MAMRSEAAAAQQQGTRKIVDLPSGSDSESLSTPSFGGGHDGYIAVPRAPAHDQPLSACVNTFIAYEKERCACFPSLTESDSRRN